MVKFRGDVVSVNVKRKKVRRTDEVVDVERVGRLVLEFDADGVDVVALSAMIQERQIYIGLADTQRSFDEIDEVMNTARV